MHSQLTQSRERGRETNNYLTYPVTEGEGKETYRPKKREKETSRDRSLLDAVTTSDPEQRKSYAHLQIHLQYIEIKTCLL